MSQFGTKASSQRGSWPTTSVPLLYRAAALPAAASSWREISADTQQQSLAAAACKSAVARLSSVDIVKTLTENHPTALFPRSRRRPYLLRRHRHRMALPLVLRDPATASRIHQRWLSTSFPTGPARPPRIRDHPSHWC